MKIKNVQYASDPSGYPYIDLSLDGESVKLFAESMKRPLLERGYVSVGEEYSGSRRIEIPKEGEYNDCVISAGVQDTELAGVCLKFLDDLAAGRQTPS